LTAALASNTNATVVAAVNAVNTDLTTVVNDLTAGTSATADITTLTSAVTTLTHDLGTSVSRTIAHELSSLRIDLRDLSQDLARVTSVVNRTSANVAADTAALTTALASNTNATVTADVTALNTALATV